uniref:Homeodomain-like protein n=1 Tax=Tanacetum cinerariifolium TaxID=118510 RepID=A0A6L2KP31_TANCI|nr:homeodomain-like protein [Tanacetum cinerariifolium]
MFDEINNIHLLEPLTLLESNISYQVVQQEETIERYLEESTKRQDSFEEWMKRFRESINKNLKRHDSTINGLEKKVEQLAQAVYASMTNDAKLIIQFKIVTTKNSSDTCYPTYLNSNTILCTFVIYNLIEHGNENLEDFLMNNEINRDFKDFLELDDLFPINGVEPFGVLSDLESEMGIRLEDFNGNLEDLLDEQGLQFRQNERSKEKNLCLMLTRGYLHYLRHRPNGFEEQENLEDFLMNNEINRDFKDFSELDDLFPINGVEPFGVLSDLESEMAIRLEDFNGNLEDLLDEQGLQFRQNENELPPKEKDPGSFILSYIIDVSEFIKKRLTEILLGRPFKDSSGLKESVTQGLVWFKFGDDKTMFQMPRTIFRVRHLSTKQCNMMAPIIRISDEDKANGFDHAYQNIKEFYKGCLQLGDEYKKDEKVIDWITYGHASVHDMTYTQLESNLKTRLLQQRERRMTSPQLTVK